MIARIRNLRRRGVLGINRRNADFVLPHNPRTHYPRVDDKLLTKRLAEAAGIPTPRSLGVVAYYHELRGLPHLLDGLAEFVLKPAHGAQGNGIIVVDRVDGGQYRKTSGAALTAAQIRQHVSNILSGLFSFHGDADSCLVEARVILHECFHDLTRHGIPDIRVVVYRGVPVMAMCRLPTAISGGRANLHQGAIGVGIDMRSGRAIFAEHHNRPVTTHVDTGAPISDLAVPTWEDVLSLASRASEISGLAYVGVDVVMDAEQGPLLLELNARPGLAIQVANNEGLLPRLRQVETLPAATLQHWQDRCRFARDEFARPAS